VNLGRLERQLAFIVEIDKCKEVLRKSLLISSHRRENDAEHAWHLASMALVLAEYAPPETDLARTVAMLLLHDLVEIDTGDVYIYDVKARARQTKAEHAAAERIFGLLPPDQAIDLRKLWTEFERRETPSAKFAAALDRFQPLLLNFNTQGRVWRHHGVCKSQVLKVNEGIADGAPELWRYAQDLIENAAREGYLVE